jgi:hypothetical protein
MGLPAPLLLLQLNRFPRCDAVEPHQIKFHWKLKSEPYATVLIENFIRESGLERVIFRWTKEDVT